jgi:polar amino acid transport system substrate-binding protein
VVLGAPVLQYYAAHDGLGTVRMVGPEFQKGDFGFIVPIDSPLRKKINGALLAMREDGSYQRIYQRWFGGE